MFCGTCPRWGSSSVARAGSLAVVRRFESCLPHVKAKKGMKVTHNSTGQSGIVTAVIRGVVHIVTPKGETASGYAGSFSKSGGLCLLWVVGVLGFASGLIRGGVYLGS